MNREADAVVLYALLREFTTHAPDGNDVPFVYWARIETRPGETLREAVERKVRDARVRAFFLQGPW